MTSLETQLEACRQRIDACDDQLLALLAQRTAVVDEVAALKPQHLAGQSFMKPGREAQIVRRLLQRDEGTHPPQLLYSLWRELMMASLQREQAFNVVVPAASGAQPHLWALARDHFGSATPLLSVADARTAMRMVREEQAMLAVLPVPEQDSAATPWWADLRLTHTPSLQIVFRLPFLRAADASYPTTQEALVVGAVTPEPSGDDATVLLLAARRNLSRDAVRQWVLDHTAKDAGAVYRWYASEAPDEPFFLVDVPGLDDAALPEHSEIFFSVRRVGRYAMPLAVSSN